MDQDTAVIKAIESIEKENNYKLEFSELQSIRRHLYLMYGVGFNEGNRQSSKWKPVLQMKSEVVLQRHPSVVDAAKKFKINPNQISKAARGDTRTSCGFDWRYEGDEDSWRYRRKK